MDASTRWKFGSSFWQPPGAQALVGVYDNLGLEWFHGWDSGRPDSAEPADFLIVANAERDPR